MLEQEETELQQAQVKAISATDDLVPSVLYRQGTQIDDPDILQARRNHQARQPLGIRHMTFVEMKPSTLLVGEKGFDPVTVPSLVKGIEKLEKTLT
jgi:hypothetical protein